MQVIRAQAFPQYWSFLPASGLNPPSRLSPPPYLKPLLLARGPFLTPAAARAVTTGLVAHGGDTLTAYHPQLYIGLESWKGREWGSQTKCVLERDLAEQRVDWGRGEETWYVAQRTSAQAMCHGRRKLWLSNEPNLGLST